jgi:hypothetical protein
MRRQEESDLSSGVSFKKNNHKSSEPGDSSLRSSKSSSLTSSIANSISEDGEDRAIRKNAI